MCLATPLKIKEIKGEKAVVESGGHSHIVDLSLIKDPKIGDYVLVHGEMAINKVDEKDAKKILEIVNGK
jgi:hydrogenase expression/formation protein HypC